MRALFFVALLSLTAYAGTYVAQWKPLPSGKRITVHVPEECSCDAQGNPVHCPDPVECVLVE